MATRDEVEADEYEKLKQDARRYRWLRRTAPTRIAAICWGRSKEACNYSDADVDKILDAAIKEDG